MSFFARELETLMAENGVANYAQLANLSGISEATFSRANKGSRQVSFALIKSIAAAIGSQPAIHARLLAARLREELLPPGGDLIEIGVLGLPPSRMGEASPDYFAKLPRLQESALLNIATAMPHDKGLRETILWLGNDIFPPPSSVPKTDSQDTEHGDTEQLDKGAAAAVKRGRTKKTAAQ